MKSILVASDLSERSEVALRRAGRIGQWTGASVEVLHVIDEGLPARVADEIRNAVASSLELDAAECEKATGVRPGVAVRSGDPWRTVVESAEEKGAGLLVLGAHRNRGLLELFMGTTVNRVARATRVPMLLAVGPADADYRRAVVGVDFSDSSARAANLAAELAPGQPPILVHGYHIALKGFLMRDANGTPASERERIEARLRRQFDRFVAGLGPDARRAETLLVEKPPLDAMQAQVKAADADLLCIGSHGRRYVEDFVLGSVASEALNYPRCDVLVVPPAPE